MRTALVYDTRYGNTRLVAQAVAERLPGEVHLLHVSEVRPGELEAADLLVIGSPTHGAMPSKALRELLAGLGAPATDGAMAAAFDTRLTWWFLEGWGGFAAEKLADGLREKGWAIVGEPAGFYVKGIQGRKLKTGELERAAEWAAQVAREAAVP